jgi:hypothetical protein
VGVAVGDFDADGRPDLAVANRFDSTVSILLNSFCPADFNCSDSVNSQDFNDFLAAFFSLSPSADFNHDTFVDSQDFFNFLAAFFTEC